MTVEQIELRKILTQMLADNGINRDTIVDFVKGIVDEKVDKAITQMMHETNIDALVDRTVKTTTVNAVKEEVAKKVRQTLGSVSISLTCEEPKLGGPGSTNP